jgi:hypothetical protein
LMFPGKDIPGLDLATGAVKATSAQQCCSICRSLAQCTAFVFTVDTCWPKDWASDTSLPLLNSRLGDGAVAGIAGNKISQRQFSVKNDTQLNSTEAAQPSASPVRVYLF